ncbi:unnamed protein product [Rhizoctonia solani]|uniref:Glucose-methanol-choline oxidoreductase N-terminal domain-containing protein n=1 Tax=Rhizoctonia solani TaxID=456999 RepID=A0A8H2X0Y7_9AGAM|nr:unnamed protein product [Rhizoctonia solani]
MWHFVSPVHSARVNQVIRSACQKYRARGYIYLGPRLPCFNPISFSQAMGHHLSWLAALITPTVLLARLVDTRNVVTVNPLDVSNQTYDYIVVGGGLTGMTVAGRLTENPNVTVLVIEAGRDDRRDPRIYDMLAYAQAFGTDMDWDWPVDQGRRIKGGKTLGGSSSINGAVYTRGHAAQYDAWSDLLTANERSLNWNWDSIFMYMKKSESFSAPNLNQTSRGAQYTASYHGNSGPLQVTFPNLMYGGPQQPAFIETVKNTHNVSFCPDLNGGSPTCASYIPLTIDCHRNDSRSSSVEAYLTPVETKRAGWTILVQQQVTKILFKDGASPALATGVQFGTSNGTRYTAYAKTEVILAAGAFMSPTLLQLSGIGDASKLSGLGIDTLVDLPAVGKNLQEQTMSTFGAKGNGFDYGGSGPSDIIAFPGFQHVFGSQAESIVSQIYSNIPAWAQSQAENGGSAAALEQVFRAQADLITKRNVPITEVSFTTGYPTDLGINMWTLLPFSRGNVQINSSDPFAKPRITVNYFAVDFDLQCQVAGARMARKILTGAPLNSLSVGETVPGNTTVPDDGSGGSDADWANWIKSKFVSVAHPVGTCAMMSRDLGGCVDGRLIVYGTKNVRVVDASAMPTQVSAHLSSTLYAFAEKAADLIKGNQ